MLGKRITYWYNCSRQFGYLYTLADSTVVIVSSKVYTSGYFLHLTDVEDLQIIYSGE